MPHELLRRIDDYLDAVLHPTARMEDVGPLRVFTRRDPAGWPYYARPIPGATGVIAGDVERVLVRQRELHIPETFEWVDEVTPSMAEAAREAGLRVHLYPLLLCEANDLRTVAPPRRATVRMAHRDDDLGLLAAVARAGFEVPGTDIADRSSDDVERFQAELSPETVAFKRRRFDRGLTSAALAELDGSIVAVGYHQPLGPMSEIVGVTTLAPYRRRGLGAAITSLLASDAFARGIATVVLSADDDAVARVYERVGFRRVGKVGAAESAA